MSYNPQDSYFKKAKQEGYRSRAAYKLLELQQRYRIIKPGDKVIDPGRGTGRLAPSSGKDRRPKWPSDRRRSQANTNPCRASSDFTQRRHRIQRNSTADHPTP
jgi:hypothetical protein